MNDLNSIILEHVQELIYAVRTNGDPLQGKVQFVSKCVESLLGYTPEEFIENPNLWISITNPDDLESVKQATLEMVETGKSAARIYRVRHKTTGQYLWFEDKPSPLLDNEGHFVGYIGVAHDITGQMHVEQQMNLQHSIAMVLAGAGNPKDTISSIVKMVCTALSWDEGELWIVDPQSTVLRCHEVTSDPTHSLAEFTRVTRETTFASGIGLPGRIWASSEPHWIPDVVEDPNFPRSLAAAKNSLHSGFGFPIVAEGRVIGVACFFSKEIRQPNADLLQMFNTIGSQIGQFIHRKHAEESLRESEERYRDLVENSHDWICTHDLEGRLLSVNEAVIRSSGYTHEYLVGANLRNLLHPSVQNQFDAYLHKIKIEREACGIMMVQTASGESRYLEYHNTLRDQGVVVPIVRGMARDITERKRGEEALRQSEMFIRAVMDNLPIGIAVNSVDPSVKFDFINDNFVKFYRTTKEAISGADNFWTAVYEDPQFREKIKKRVLDDCASGDPTAMYWEDIPITRKGEETSFITARNIPLPNSKLMISTVWDVTERKRAEEAITQQAAEYETMLSTITQGFWLVDEHGRLLDVNDAYCSMSGYSKDELLQLTIQDLEAAESLEETARRIQVIMETGTDRFESKHRAKDGRVHDVEISAAFWREKKRFFVFIQDIAERKRAEDALKLFRTLIDRSNDAIEVLDPETGRLLDVNEKGCLDLGYSREEFLALTIFDIDPMLDQTSFAGAMEELRIAGALLWEGVHRRKDGTTFPVEVNIKHVRLDQEYIITVVRDITDRKLAEEALKQSEEKYRKFFEEDLAGAYISTPDGKILACNPAFARIFGFESVGEVLNTNAVTLYSNPSERESFIKELTEVNRIEYREMELLRRDGKNIFTVESAIGKFNDEKELIEIHGYLIDVTKRRELEAQLIQAQKMESLGTLAGGIAHDFNNVLAIILGHIKLIHRKFSDNEYITENADTITKAIQRGTAMVRQLLTFARKTDVVLESVLIQDTINEIRNFLKQTFQRTIAIHTECEKNLPPIVADSTQIHQVLLNLCINARDAMPHGGVLSITANKVNAQDIQAKIKKATSDEYIHIAVSDTGTGMNEATKSRIFEPFFSTKPRESGTGLGLSTVYGIIEAHQGFIDVDTEIGKGTSFNLYFPVQQGFIEHKAKEISSEEIPGGKETILMVDDEEAMRSMLRTVFEEKGYHVLTAADGQEALDLYARRHKEIDLVFTDMGLPKISGEEVVSGIKKINANAKIIVASGYFERNLKSELLKTGVKDFAQKPYLPDDILKKVREVLDLK